MNTALVALLLLATIVHEAMGVQRAGGDTDLAELKAEVIALKGKKSAICGLQQWSSQNNEGTIIYTTVYEEVEEANSRLDKDTGVYTAGVDGVYKISVSGIAEVWPYDQGVRVNLTGAGNTAEDAFFINSSVICQSYMNANGLDACDGDGGYILDTAAATRYVTLDANQQISLWKNSGDFSSIKFCVSLYDDMSVDGSKKIPKKEITALKRNYLKSAICGYQPSQKPGTIKYETVHNEVEEANSVLDKDTGVYTAGVDGVYEISVSGNSYVDKLHGDDLKVNLVGDGNSKKEFVRSYNSNEYPIWETSAASRYVTLTAGQELSIEQSGGGYFFQVKFCVTLYKANVVGEALSVPTTGDSTELVELQAEITALQRTNLKSVICGYIGSQKNAGTIKYTTVQEEVEELNSVLDKDSGVYTAGVSGVYEISVSAYADLQRGDEVKVALEGVLDSWEVVLIHSQNFGVGVFADTCSATRYVTLTADQQFSLQKSGGGSLNEVKFCVTLYKEIATCAPDKPEKWEGSCKKWKNKGYCTTDKYIDFMKENCDTTCNCNCAPDKPEKWEGSCKSWKNKGHCTTDKYIDFMKENCDTTCNCTLD